MLPCQHSVANAPRGQEQSNFTVELEIGPIQRPVQLSGTALSTLSKDKRVASCLEDAGLRPEQLTADWFIASEIHLGGPRERDLIVQPGGPIPGTPPGEVSQNFCLVGANTAQFWVLRKTPQGFALVVSQMAHDLKVLRTRTNGLRDIRLAAAVGGYYAALDYRFNGHSYEIAGRSSELTGAEIPHDLSGYETAKPFLQPRGQPSGPIFGRLITLAKKPVRTSFIGQKPMIGGLRLKSTESVRSPALPQGRDAKWSKTNC